MSDMISRQTAISAICNACGKIDCDKMDKCEKLQLLPANSSEFPNNSDTISRQAAIDSFKMDDDGTKWSMDDIVYRLKQMPSAQPEIIRCKDCKWYKTNYSWNGKEHKVCVIEPYEPIRKGDDFCSRGERRTDEAD